MTPEQKEQMLEKVFEIIEEQKKQKRRRRLRNIAVGLGLAGAGYAGYQTRSRWMPYARAQYAAFRDPRLRVSLDTTMHTDGDIARDAGIIADQHGLAGRSREEFIDRYTRLRDSTITRDIPDLQLARPRLRDMLTPDPIRARRAKHENHIVMPDFLFGDGEQDAAKLYGRLVPGLFGNLDSNGTGEAVSNLMGRGRSTEYEDGTSFNRFNNKESVIDAFRSYMQQDPHAGGLRISGSRFEYDPNRRRIPLFGPPSSPASDDNSAPEATTARSILRRLGIGGTV